MHWTYTVPRNFRRTPRLIIVHVVSHGIHLYRIYLVLLVVCPRRLFPRLGIHACIYTAIMLMLLTQTVVVAETPMEIMSRLSLQDLRQTRQLLPITGLGILSLLTTLRLLFPSIISTTIITNNKRTIPIIFKF